MAIRKITGGGTGSVTDAYEICQNSDIEKISGYSNGVITVPTGTILTIEQRCSPIISDVEFVLQGTAEVRITSDLAKASWLYTGAGTFISGQGIRFSIFNMEIVSTASPSKFIDTVDCTLAVDGTAIAGFDDLGRMEGTGLTAFDVSGANVFIDGFSTGLELKNMVISASGLVLTSQTLVDDAINIDNDIALPIVSLFSNVITLMRPQNNIFNVTPISTTNFKMSVSNVQPSGGEGLFNTSGGQSGTFTAVSDAGGGILTLTDIGTTLNNGDAITISTDNALTYDGGYIVSNVQTNSFDISATFIGSATGSWSTAHLDQTSPNISVINSPPFEDSTSKAEVFAQNNLAVTDIPAAGARVLINASNWNVISNERFKTSSDGGVIYFGTDPAPVLLDGNIYLEPSQSTKNLSSQFVRIDNAQVTCTFNTVNNAVTTSSAHGLAVGDTVSFKTSGGVIDGAVRGDIIYYVQSIVSTTEFTLSYTDGGALIPLIGGSSGDTSYSAAIFVGSLIDEPVAENAPRTLVPQGLAMVERGDRVYNVVANNDDNTANIVVTRPYYRVSR